MIVGRDTKSLGAARNYKSSCGNGGRKYIGWYDCPTMLSWHLEELSGGFFYKAVNTMDSVVGYHNDRYQNFGKVAAKLDDVVNFIPARISALCMIFSAYVLGMNGVGAWKIFRRDRYQHKSPNSAQTEAACAGALNVQLAGNAWYFGVLHEKPTIGDDLRPVEAEDIRRANRLMYGTRNSGAAWTDIDYCG